jgi:hypothetical protein
MRIACFAWALGALAVGCSPAPRSTPTSAPDRDPRCPVKAPAEGDPCDWSSTDLTCEYSSDPLAYCTTVATCQGPSSLAGDAASDANALDSAPGDSSSYDTGSDDAGSGDEGSDDTSSDDAGSGDAALADGSSDDGSSGDKASSEAASGDGSSGDGSSGDGNSDDASPGDAGSGDGAFADAGSMVPVAGQFHVVRDPTCSVTASGCPASVANLNGAQCPQDGLTCHYAQAVCGCSCESSYMPVWSCRSRASVPSYLDGGLAPSTAPACPSSRPLLGDACALEGQICEYGGVCGSLSLGPSMQCDGGYWRPGDEFAGVTCYPATVCPN